MDKRILLIMTLFVIAVIAIGMTTASAKPRAKKACMDGSDNDGDGYTDYPADPGCSSRNDDSELNPAVECDDGDDNDGDGDTDYNDGGCTGPTDNDETDCGDSVCEGGEVCDVCVADCGLCDSCSDTDGGFNEYVQGTVYGIDEGQNYTHTDYCASGTNLMEYYCIGIQWLNWETECMVGNQTGTCVNGACV